MKKILIFLFAAAIMLGAGVLGTKMVVGAAVQKRFDEALAKLGDDVSVSYGKFHYRMGDQQIVARKVMVVPEFLARSGLVLQIPVEEMIVDRVDHDVREGVLTNLHLRLSGVRLQQVNADGTISSVMQGLGYENPVLGLDFEYQFNPDTSVLSVRKLHLSGPEIGSLDFTARVGNVKTLDSAILSGGVVEQVLSLAAVTFHSGEVQIQDRGFVPRYLDYQARAQQISQEDYIASVLKTFKSTEKKVRPSSEMITAIETFLRHPDTIRIRAKPVRPVDEHRVVIAMFLGGNLLDLYGVQVTN